MKAVGSLIKMPLDKANSYRSLSEELRAIKWHQEMFKTIRRVLLTMGGRPMQLIVKELCKCEEFRWVKGREDKDKKEIPWRLWVDKAHQAGWDPLNLLKAERMLKRTSTYLPWFLFFCLNIWFCTVYPTCQQALRRDDHIHYSMVL